MLAIDTQLVAACSAPHSLLDLNGALIYADGSNLFKVSDTPASPTLLKEFNRIELESSGRLAGNQLLFTADDAEHGRELWKTDGTPEGTMLVKDIVEGAGGSGPESLLRIGGTVFFAASDAEHGRTLWKTDGTTEGTAPVPGIYPEAPGAWFSPPISSAQGVYFTVNRYFDWDSWTQLWVTDGTANGTVCVLETWGGGVQRVGDALYVMTGTGIWQLGDDSPDEDTPGVYDPQNSVFYLRNSNSGGFADITAEVGLPHAGLIPLAGDLNRDGLPTITLYNPANSVFYTWATNDSGSMSVARRFGAPGAGWLPVIGDWNGDGRDTVGLYDPATSLFYLTNYSDADHPYAEIAFGYGVPGAGWRPIAGDWDGDGFDSIGLYDPATSLFHLRNSSTIGYADITLACGAVGAGWAPLAGDWNHDAMDTIGLYDPAASVFYENNTHNSGYADVALAFGSPGMVPIVGDWDALGGLPTTENRTVPTSYSALSLNPLAVDLTLGGESSGLMH